MQSSKPRLDCSQLPGSTASGCAIPKPSEAELWEPSGGKGSSVPGAVNQQVALFKLRPGQAKHQHKRGHTTGQPGTSAEIPTRNTELFHP